MASFPALDGAEEALVEVNAADFGYEAADATAALQAAIDFGARRVIVPDMGKPWVLRPIKLRGGLELIFEKGAEIVAMRGAFLGKNDCLFSAEGAQGITLRGAGNRLRMFKEDYHKPPYEPAEWRHCLSFKGCSDVLIENLVLENSGGDGIYLGTSRDRRGCERCVIRHVQSLNHNRQGISVINATDLLIEHSSFNQTVGTAPMAGIDLEPNHKEEKLKNIRVRHCTFEQNDSYGILLYLRQLTGESEPVFITFEDCLVRANFHGSLSVTLRNPDPVDGKILFRRCQFVDSPGGASIKLSKPARGASLVFEDCSIGNVATKNPQVSPIQIIAGSSRGENALEPVGGIHFGVLRLHDPLERRAIEYDQTRGLPLEGVTGEIQIENETGGRRVVLTQELLDTWFPWTAAWPGQGDFDLPKSGLEPLNPDAARDFPDFPGWLRGAGEFVFSVPAADTPVHFTLRSRKIGGVESPPAIQVWLVTPAGEVRKLESAPVGKETSYQVWTTAEGTHRIRVEAGTQAFACHSASMPVNAYSVEGSFRFIHAAGELFFAVPPGAKFQLVAAGDNRAEKVRVIVKDDSGKTRADEDDIFAARAMTFSSTPDAGWQVWSVRLARPSHGTLEDYRFRLKGIPALLAPAPASLLVPGAPAR